MTVSRKSAALAASLCVALASPAAALTNDNGVVVFTQADALAGGVTPGDTPGFPVTISTPGSYRLGSGLTVSSGTGIDITGAEVTLDFAGFRIIGSGTASTGVAIHQRAATIRNGTIRAFVGTSVLTPGSNATTTTIENMRFADIASLGVNIDIYSPGSRIVNNLIRGGAYGIGCVPNCHIEGNSIMNSGVGISVSLGATIIGNLITGNSVKPIQALDAVEVGFGDNTILVNGGASTGDLQTMSPNACDPAC